MTDSDADREVNRRAARGWYFDTAALTGIVGIFVVAIGERGWGILLLIISVFCFAMWRRLRRKNKVTDG